MYIESDYVLCNSHTYANQLCCPLTVLKNPKKKSVIQLIFFPAALIFLNLAKINVYIFSINLSRALKVRLCIYSVQFSPYFSKQQPTVPYQKFPSLHLHKNMEVVLLNLLVNLCMQCALKILQCSCRRQHT